MIRIGVDFGGSKIEAAAIDAAGGFQARVRKPNPGGYVEALAVVRDLVDEAERQAGFAVSHVGVGSPGSISPATGLMRGANSTWLNDRAFAQDLETVLGRRVSLENDANCFALSEAMPDFAQAVVFGAIIGTGCGSGIVDRGWVISGRNKMAGEWGHSPLPWPEPDEYRAHRCCWCGLDDCIETWISGSAFEADYAVATGRTLKGPAIIAAMEAGEAEAEQAYLRYASRLARSLAMVCNLIDPDIIVLGGGMSNVTRLYDGVLTAEVGRLVFTDSFETRIIPPRFGDSSGVRGAAWLVPQ